MWNRLLTSCIPIESFFLFGPRQVGKSTLLVQIPAILRLDLLRPEDQLLYTKDPGRLRREVHALAPTILNSPGQWVIIDEIQRATSLLDVVQECMGRYPNLRWILTGSSARKLRKNHANLLGGRALVRTLHPLTFDELGQDFDLLSVLEYGSLPRIYSEVKVGKHEVAHDLLRSYVTTYLSEEIKAEALVRNLQGFQNFLELAAAQFGEQINFSEFSKEAQISKESTKEYYQILEDTFIGFFLLPYLKSRRKRMSHQPKFYLFDNGVTRALTGSLRSTPQPVDRGRLFEQWLFQEVFRINHYDSKDWKLLFWRTSHGAEVDLVVERGRQILFVVEFKFKKILGGADLTGLRAFRDSSSTKKIPCYLVAPIQEPQKLDEVEILPPLQFLKKIRFEY